MYIGSLSSQQQQQQAATFFQMKQKVNLKKKVSDETFF